MMSEKTVLIVEDHVETRAIHTLFLQTHGYRVMTARDGIEAVRTARESAPHLILMDLSIPLMDGLSATEELKRDPATRDIPVVAFTAHSYGSAGRRARDAGCEGFLSKPCDPRRVLREVHERIGAPDVRTAC
jgi:two-component system, cell cycle response regulator DivK